KWAAQQRREQCALSWAQRIGVGERGFKILGFVGVTQTHSKVELVRYVENIMREESEILAFLIIDINITAAIINLGQIIQPRENQRSGRAKSTCQCCPAACTQTTCAGG